MAEDNGNSLLMRLFPFLSWIKDYKPSLFRSDLIAGLTVALVLIPQSMAYAILAGLPPVIGLYAAAITPAIAALWGNLKQLSTGPFAILSLLVFTTLSAMATPVSQNYIEMAVLLTLIIGVINLIIGFFRLSIIVSFTSLSIIKGFTSASALIIMSTQLPSLLGVNIKHSQFFVPTIYNTIIALPDAHLPTLILGISSLAIIVLVRKISTIPSGLIALIIATIFTGIFRLDLAGIPIVGTIEAGLPSFNLPFFDMHIVTALIGPALVMVLISNVETYSIGKTIAMETKQKVDWNREFIGQGLANVIGSFFGTMPVSGSFARTAINYKTGAKTAMSSVISAGAVIIALLFFTGWLFYMPKSALAAMVISAVFFLFHPRQVFKLYKKNRDDGIVAISVFILSLLIKLDYALLISVSISLIFFIWKSMHPRIIRVTRALDYKIEINGDELNKPSCPQIFHIRSDNSIFFVNAEYTVQTIREKLEKQASKFTKYFILDFESVAFIDITAIEEFKLLKAELEEKGIKMAIMGLHIPVEKVFRSTGFIDEFDPELIFDNRNELIPKLFEKLDHNYCVNECPYTLFPCCLKIRNEEITFRDINE
jgi:SulP family sulfate permease